MAGEPIRVALQREDFDLNAETARVKALSPGIGGLVIFLGTARDESGGKRVVHLDFESFPELAAAELRALAAEARQRFSLLGITIVHRLGVIPPGENIVLIVAGAAHRVEAFAAAGWCIDELKKRVPIWKKEVFADGQAWVQETP